MVATVHPLATRAGVDAMRNGGNAVDAAVTAALTLGVVDGHNSGIGGGCFILIRLADGQLVAIDGRETAPAAAHRDMYVIDGEPQTQLSKTGPLAVAVPGALAAYEAAVTRYGDLELADLLQPAAVIAEEGFPIDGPYARALAATAESLARFAGSRAMLLFDQEALLEEGDTLRLPDLARTYRAIAEQGIDWFYRGPLAQQVGAWMAENGGILTAEDFAIYRPLDRQPLVTGYRGYTIVGFPPPSSGGVHVAQILNVVEPFNLRDMHAEDPAAPVHIVVEAMRRAFADRAHWLGDPAFANVPLGLVDPQYGQQLAANINPRQTTIVATHGRPPRAGAEFFGRQHTTHIAAADAQGNWVAITATINTTFGSKVVVPGTGVVLNNEMDDFSIQPGVPNTFGLIGAEANAVAPGKRPLSSMSPTIVLRQGSPVLTLGAAGGPAIISQIAQTLVRLIDLEMELPEAVAAPRFHHQWTPPELLVEEGFDREILVGLRERGHVIETRASIGVLQAIGWDAENREFLGIHDPRVPGAAAGY
ncbi:MAG: gamma-glutamyltransferase [Pirellulales bacterium]